MNKNKFEWDHHKLEINIEKHHIDFVDAIEIFDDKCRIEQIMMHESGEERRITIGKVNEVTILVVYTKRGEFTRLISARRASKNERKYYEDQI